MGVEITPLIVCNKRPPNRCGQQKVAEIVQGGEALLIKLVGNKLHFAMESGIPYPGCFGQAD